MVRTIENLRYLCRVMRTVEHVRQNILDRRSCRVGRTIENLRHNMLDRR